MPKKFLTAQSATFKVLPADTGIAKATDDPMGVKGLNPFHDLMAGFVKVDAEGQPYTVGVLPDTVSILGSDTILIAEDPSDTFTFSIVDPLQLTGLGIGTPGEAGTVKFTGTGNVKTAGGDYEATETISAGAGVSGTQFVWNLADFSGAPVVRNLNFALSPTISLSPTDGTGDVDLGRVGEPWGTGYINTLTRDAGILTLSTTTSGGIVFSPFGGADRMTLRQIVGPGADVPSLLLNGVEADFPYVPTTLRPPVNIRTYQGVGLALTDTADETFSDTAFAPLMISVDVPAANVALMLVNRDTAKLADFVASRWKVRDGDTDNFVEGIFEYQSSGFDDGQSWFGVAFDNSNADVVKLHSNGSVSASGGYIANGETGIDTTITTGSLVGKTITITKGIITGFA